MMESHQTSQGGSGAVKSYDRSATITIDEKGYARVMINDNLGYSLGDRIPLWSEVEGRLIGELEVRPGPIRNGHTII